VTQVLDLSTLFERDTVKMPDGSSYELRNPQEFGVLDEHKMRALMKKAADLDAVSDPTDAQAAEAAKILHDLATMLIVDLRDEIPDWACVAIFRFWIEKAGTDEPGDGSPRKPRTTAASSRGSKRSTAATRTRGSKSRAGR